MTGMQGTHTAVVGLGVSGFACARYLTRLGSRVSVLDDAERPALADRAEAELPGCRFHFGGLDERLLGGQDEIFVSPGVPRQRPELRHADSLGVKLSGDVELFARERRRLCPNLPLLAVTGTNGKSTVTAWLSRVLEQLGVRVATGGNIGTPILELLDREAECFVVELSSFQLEGVHELSATAACILNLAPDHLDRYPDLAAYLAAKMRIFSSCTRVLANRDEASVRVAADFSFGLDAPGQASEFGLCDDHVCQGDERLLRTSSLPLPGRHNQTNAMAVLAFVAAFGLAPATAAGALQKFSGLPHRCRPVRSLSLGRRRLHFINDSKATNVGATVAALDGLKGRVRICLLAGGQGKSADFAPLADALGDGTELVLLFGEDAALMARALGDKVPWELAENLARALARAVELARKADSGDWLILLSPACASFDAFRNYEERGAYFERLVLALDDEAGP